LEVLDGVRVYILDIGLVSFDMGILPNNALSTVVVPLPAKGSKIISPTLEYLTKKK